MVRLIASALLCAALVFADEAADRTAIEAIIHSLDAAKPPAGLFTADAQSDLDRLLAARPDQPNGVWSEVPPGIPNPVTMPAKSFLRIDSVSFLSSDVAVANVTEMEMGGYLKKIPVLMVMKREDGAWKVAVLRVLASGVL